MLHCHSRSTFISSLALPLLAVLWQFVNVSDGVERVGSWDRQSRLVKQESDQIQQGGFTLQGGVPPVAPFKLQQHHRPQVSNRLFKQFAG